MPEPMIVWKAVGVSLAHGAGKRFNYYLSLLGVSQVCIVLLPQL